MRRPLYARALGLRHVHPGSWQRAALGEGSLAFAVVVVMADLASAWLLVALPVAVATVVKAHDVVAGALREPAAVRGDVGPVATRRSPGIPASLR